ncbi:MAG: DUF1440 domain-containing protein [Chitinophagaceae bacterium]
MKYGKEIAVGIAGGLFASWVKALVEPPLQEAGEKYFPPSNIEIAQYGADVSNHPEKMPPAVMADDVYNFFTKKELSDRQKVRSLKAIHYVFGALVGVGYVIAAKKSKKVTVGEGVAAGAAVWCVTHGSTLPALGLQGPVKKMPKSWYLWELGSHLIFGGALEASRKLLDGAS